MPIQTTVYHPDRLIIGVATGPITFDDFVKYGLEVLQGGLTHYRKILDVLDAQPVIKEQEFLAMVQLIREVRPGKRRGPLAFVADRKRGDLARLFARLEVDGRPAQVFPSIREARQWLAQHPVDE